jgi:hypothetical protein
MKWSQDHRLDLGAKRILEQINFNAIKYVPKHIGLLAKFEKIIHEGFFKAAFQYKFAPIKFVPVSKRHIMIIQRTNKNVKYALCHKRIPDSL